MLSRSKALTTPAVKKPQMTKKKAQNSFFLKEKLFHSMVTPPAYWGIMFGDVIIVGILLLRNRKSSTIV